MSLHRLRAFHLPRSRAPPAVATLMPDNAEMPFTPFMDAIAVVLAGESMLPTGDVALLLGEEPGRDSFGILLGRVGDELRG